MLTVLSATSKDRYVRPDSTGHYVLTSLAEVSDEQLQQFVNSFVSMENLVDGINSRFGTAINPSNRAFTSRLGQLLKERGLSMPGKAYGRIRDIDRVLTNVLQHFTNPVLQTVIDNSEHFSQIFNWLKHNYVENSAFNALSFSVPVKEHLLERLVVLGLDVQKFKPKEELLAVQPVMPTSSGQKNPPKENQMPENFLQKDPDIQNMVSKYITRLLKLANQMDSKDSSLADKLEKLTIG